MRKITAALIILSIFILTAIVSGLNTDLHKTFQIDRIIIKQGAGY